MAPLQMLAQWHGCKVVLSNPSELAALEEDPADVVVEATGSSQGFDSARRLVRPGGTLVLKSTFPGKTTPVNLNSVVVDEITVLGSRCGPFMPALRMLEQGKVQVTPLISGCYALEDVAQALEHAQRRGALKVLVRP
jgi:threonine dehydrogenase-like Zn-dependent dehydrogenase